MDKFLKGNSASEVNNSDFQKNHAKEIFSMIGIVLTIMLILIQGIETGFYFIMNNVAPELWKKPWMSWVMVTVGFYITAFPVYCILMKKIPNTPKGKPESMSIFKLIALFFIGMATLYSFNMLSMIINSLLGLLKGGAISNPLDSVIKSSNLFYTLLFVGIIAPIIEEIIFRGIMLDKLRCYGDKTAMWITALTFGFFHLNTTQVIYATALGILFAYVAIRTNRIIYSIILHMGVNIMGSVVAPALSTAGHLDIVGALVIFFVLIGGVLFFVLRKKLYLEKGTYPIDKKVITKTIYFNPGMLIYFGACIIFMAVMIIL